MLMYAIIFINLALILYSVGVWAEKLQGILKPWHVVVFWAGLVCDTTGTAIMNELAGPSSSLNFHAVTGVLAILLMLFHAVWAVAVIVRKDARQLKTFHKFSIFVWVIWLIPFISGMLMGMS